MAKNIPKIEVGRDVKNPKLTFDVAGFMIGDKKHIGGNVEIAGEPYKVSDISWDGNDIKMVLEKNSKKTTFRIKSNADFWVSDDNGQKVKSDKVVYNGTVYIEESCDKAKTTIVSFKEWIRSKVNE